MLLFAANSFCHFMQRRYRDETICRQLNALSLPSCAIILFSVSRFVKLPLWNEEMVETAAAIMNLNHMYLPNQDVFNHNDSTVPFARWTIKRAIEKSFCLMNHRHMSLKPRTSFKHVLTYEALFLVLCQGQFGCRYASRYAELCDAAGRAWSIVSSVNPFHVITPLDRPFDDWWIFGALPLALRARHGPQKNAIRLSTMHCRVVFGECPSSGVGTQAY
jgi:hypothetical protein